MAIQKAQTSPTKTTKREPTDQSVKDAKSTSTAGAADVAAKSTTVKKADQPEAVQERIKVDAETQLASRKLANGQEKVIAANLNDNLDNKIAEKAPVEKAAAGLAEKPYDVAAAAKENRARIEAADTTGIKEIEGPPVPEKATGKGIQDEVKRIEETYGAATPEAEKRSLRAKSEGNRYTPADPGLMEGIKAGGSGELVRGHQGEGVRETQGLLNKFGFGLAEDGLLGPRSEAALRQFQKASGLPETGEINADTYKALQEGDPAALKDKLNLELPGKLNPISNARMPTAQRQQMIQDAIRSDPGIPDAWANDPSKLAAINRIVEKESGWRVGIPNYTIRNAGMTGDQAANLLQTNKNLTRFGASSSAMGLFQLLGTNMDKYQPGGRAGIGDANSEMVGGLKYLVDRYGTPERALAFHNANNWW